MKIIKTKATGLYIIKNKIHVDKRGFLKEIYKKKIFNQKLIFDYYSVSKKDVFRGMHFQLKPQQSKLITVIKGKIIDYVLDLRKYSKTFKKLFKFELSERNNKSIFIPSGFAHGFFCLGDENILLYKNSNLRNVKSEYSLDIFSDYNLGISKNRMIISDRDKKGTKLQKFISKIGTL